MVHLHKKSPRNQKIHSRNPLLVESYTQEIIVGIIKRFSEESFSESTDLFNWEISLESDQFTEKFYFEPGRQIIFASMDEFSLEKPILN